MLDKVDGTAGNFMDIGTAIFPVGERSRMRLDKSVTSRESELGIALGLCLWPTLSSTIVWVRAECGKAHIF